MNKTFKDFIEEDLDVFFNVDEMAEEHELDGETLLLIVVDNRSDNNITGFSKEHLYSSQEVYKQHKTLYIKASDYFVPTVDSVITLDATEYYVEEATEAQGVIRIVLSLNES